MSQIFHPSWNVIARASILATFLGGAWIIWILAAFERSPYLSTADRIYEQPVPFSHEHHVGGLGIDCRYCHTTVENSAFAGMPPIKTCMTCHSVIWTNAEMLEPVRKAWETSTPIVWNRVNNLPSYVYFNHSAHIQKGIGCSTCHGQVDQMALMMPAMSLQMRWCLTCHREPELFIRPRDEVFNLHYEPPPNQLELGRELVKKYHVLPRNLMESCSLCHR